MADHETGKQGIRWLPVLLAFAAATAMAAARDEIVAPYRAAQTDPAFSGFSAKRGEAFHRRVFAAGKADTPACTSCHGNDARSSGRTPAGKVIEPMALSVSPARYADPAKVEKWFKRNCNEVLGRECTAQEKGDWLVYMASQ